MIGLLNNKKINFLTPPLGGVSPSTIFFHCRRDVYASHSVLVRRVLDYYFGLGKKIRPAYFRVTVYGFNNGDPILDMSVINSTYLKVSFFKVIFKSFIQ